MKWLYRLAAYASDNQSTQPRSYGMRAGLVQFLWPLFSPRKLGMLICAAGLLLAAVPANSADRTLKIVAFGDSLIAGYGLPENEAFPGRLQAALKAKGLDVVIINAGVSGDTSTGGLGRLDWSIPEDTDAVIVELGANDALRGIDPAVTRKALTEIVERLKARNIDILLCGMLAPRNMGQSYADAYDAIFADLAKGNGILLYPFFLDGVAIDPKFTLRDGIHPNAAGVAEIVKRILPKAEELIARARARRGA